jgi:predicted glycoside hydrolase/deacetylase ChbG (UPF0249 family)
MTRRLIVSGDDLGLHEAINRGVVEAHESGIVTSASIVACGRAFAHACELASARPGLDLGIHLTLVEERPVLGPSVLKTLAPDGVLPPNYVQLFLGLLAGRIDTREVEIELDAQIDRVLSTGLKVSHLDSHQHTHFFPLLRPIFLRLAKRHGIGALRAGGRIIPSPTKFSLLLAPLAKRMKRGASDVQIKTPDALWLPAKSGSVSAAQLVAGIEALPEGVTELVMHPGADQSALERQYPTWGFDWPLELATTLAADVRQALVRHNVQLTRYSELT